MHHNRGALALDRVGNRIARAAPLRAYPISGIFRRSPRVRFVVQTEVPGASDAAVANHPQSLWITLWASFRGRSQVAYRKGFFLVCSSFERQVFSQGDQGLT
jgi:hypothetical protein